MAELRIDVSTDAADAVAGLADVGAGLDKVGSKAAGAATDLSKSTRGLDDVASASDNLASASSQTAGGLGDLGGALGLLPGPLGAVGRGMEAAAPAIMGVTGAADLLNVVTEKYPKVGALAAKATNVLAIAKRGLGVAIRFALGPVGLVITGLTLLVGALVLAYKRSETFRTIVDGAFKAIGAAGRFMWNNVLQPVFSLLLRGIATIADGYAKLLRGMSKVPGFGWARRAADLMQNGANKARTLADRMGKIPNVRASVTTPGMDAAIRKAHQLAQAFTNAAAAYLDIIGLGRLASGRTTAETTSFGRVSATPGPAAAPTINITVNGALDPLSVARQIEQIMRQATATRTGVLV